MKFVLEISDVGSGVSPKELASMVHSALSTVQNHATAATSQTAMFEMNARFPETLQDGGGNTRGWFGFVDEKGDRHVHIGDRERMKNHGVWKCETCDATLIRLQSGKFERVTGANITTFVDSQT